MYIAAFDTAIAFKTDLFYLAPFKWNLYVDAWKKYQANTLTSPSMLELGLGLSEATNLSAFLYAPALFHNLTTNHDPVKRYVKMEDI